MGFDSTFQVRYWGVTGTFAATLSPGEIEAKVVRSVLHLVRSGRIQKLPTDCSAESIERLLEETTPAADRSTYGSNTTCIEIRTPKTLFILDMGSGARALGHELASRWDQRGDDARREVQILLSHAHMDHTFATPYFEPFYDSRNRCQLWGSEATLNSLRAVLDLDGPMRQVYFPTTFEMMGGLASLNTVTAGDSWTIDDTTISTMSLNHPGGCLAFKLEREGRVIVFASDHEHEKVPDAALADFARGADLLYTDAQYMRVEYEGKQGIRGEPGVARTGWGHSTVEDVVVTGLSADVQRLHIGHHEPRRSDQQLATLAEYVAELADAQRQAVSGKEPRCHVELAREGPTWEI